MFRGWTIKDRKFFALYIAIILVIHLAESVFAERTEDHLLPVPEYLGSAPLYRKLWQEKLLITPGDLARFVRLPGSRGVEVVVSMFQDYQRTDALPGGYWLTMTEPSIPLSGCYPKEGNPKHVDPRTVQIKRLDVPLPQSTAHAIHELWLTMLKQTKPDVNSERYLAVDTTTEIFSARDAEGKVLEAQAPSHAIGTKANTTSLVRIGWWLLDYSEASPSDRARLARKIELHAVALQRKVAAKAK